jgi:hypothetical protein
VHDGQAQTARHGERAERGGGTPESSPASAGAGAPRVRRPGRRPSGWRAVVTVAVLGAVWWPARPGGSDGFPLSSYPMFGYARPPTSKVETVLGVDTDGARRPLSPGLIAGVSQPKLALARVREAIERRHTAALCRDVARRVAERPASERLVALEVVSDTWDTIEGLRPGAAPTKRVVHERCEVAR